MTQTMGRKEMSQSKEKKGQSLQTIEYFLFKTALRLQNTFSGKCYQRKYLEHICWRAGGGGTTFAEQTEIYKHLNLEKIGILKIAPVVSLLPDSSYLTY